MTEDEDGGGVGGDDVDDEVVVVVAGADGNFTVCIVDSIERTENGRKYLGQLWSRLVGRSVLNRYL